MTAPVTATASMADMVMLWVSVAGAKRCLLAFDWGHGETVGGGAGDQNSRRCPQRDDGLMVELRRALDSRETRAWVGPRFNHLRGCVGGVTADTIWLSLSREEARIVRNIPDTTVAWGAAAHQGGRDQ